MRTNAGAVVEILGHNYDTINCPPLIPYIRTATLIIDDVVSCAAGKGVVHSAARLAEMEMWVSAYLYTINDPIYKAKATADASATYFDRSYLDAAKLLDNTGCLSSILSGNRAGLDWLGKPPSTQIDYVDRD